MSSAPLDRNRPPQNENRRLYLRRRIDQLTYATFGPDNGGILINLSEGGLSFQGVGVVDRDQLIRIHFTLPGMTWRIEATGQVVWSNDSGKGGGLRFLDLTEETRQRLKDWTGGGSSAMATLMGQVMTHSRTAVGFGKSERNSIQSVPVLEETEEMHLPRPAPISSEPRVSKTRQIFSSPSMTEARSENVAAPAPKVPRLLTEPHKPDAPSAPRTQYVAFATGVMAGCVVVLAVIAGVRMLGNAGRQTPPVVAQSSGAQPASGQLKLNSPVDRNILNDRPRTLNLDLDKESGGTIPAASESLIRKPPARVVKPSEMSARFETNATPPQDSRQKNLNDQSFALPAPHIPSSPAGAGVRQPSISDGVALGPASMEGPRAAALSMPDPPKPPKPSPETVDRTGSFLEAVLIEHNPPVYPPSAKKNHIEGLVRVSATIGTDGVPRHLKLVSGDPSLGQAVEEAISSWRYVPAVFRGTPVESNTIITIRFQIKP